jgi:hypothetical protein
MASSRYVVAAVAGLLAALVAAAEPGASGPHAAAPAASLPVALPRGGG